MDKVWCWGLFASALVIRLVHLLTVRDSPFFNYLFIDPKMYDEWGLRIAHGSLLSADPFFLDPLYPYFVGGVYAVFGRSYLAVAAVQGLLGAVVPVLIFLATRPWLGRATARTAGAIAVLYPVTLYYGGTLLKPGLAVFVVSLALWLLSRAMHEDRIRWWVPAGVALGLAVLCRGNLLLVVPVLALALLLWGGRESSRPRWRSAAALLAGVLSVLLLPLAHNFAVSGEWILTTTNWGQIFFIGNNADNPSGRFVELSYVRSNPAFEQVDFKSEAERRTGRRLGHGETSRYWLGEGLAWARAHPGDWLGLMLSKLRILWGAYETPASQDYYLYRRHAPLLGLPMPAFGLLGPLGLLGAVFAWSRRGWPRLLVVYVAAATLAVIPFFVLTRFRMVLVPALYVLAALGAVELVRRCAAAFGGREQRPAWWTAGLFVVFFVLVNVPVRKTADTWSYRLAGLLHLPRQLETTAGGRFNLGVTYANVAKEAEDSGELLLLAEVELRAAVAEEPEYDSYVELGKVLARQQRNEEAIEAYADALALEPRAWRARYAQGLLYRRIGDRAAAAAAFRQVLALVPVHAASAIRLGEVLLEDGRHAEAAQAFRHALSLRPGDEAATRGLAAAERGP